jgi:hypothetical protein
MKQTLLAVLCGVIGLAVAAGGRAGRPDRDDHRFHFVPGTIVLSRSVYAGNADTVVIGETLPLGCVGGPNGMSTVVVPTTTPGQSVMVQVMCGVASDNGEFPNLNDNHNVWNNSGTDGSFGISSPIFLDNLTTDGRTIDVLPIPSHKIVTSFSSKSELALNRSVDGRSLTFIGYHGGPGCGGGPVSPTRPNLIDVSASNTPGVCDPTNPVITSFRSDDVVPTAYYRAVAEVSADGDIDITDGNAYSGDNGRAAKKGGNGLYYMAGNDNSGNLAKAQLCSKGSKTCTQIGIDLVNSTGAELRVPGTAAPLPPNITEIGRLEFGNDKPGKDTNFRGLTIFDNTLYVSKGSGGNGINTVYQAGAPGQLPTGDAADLAGINLNILNGFPNTTNSVNTNFPFGMFFANANTLYVCDEGDGTFVPNQVVNGVPNVADAQSLATAGLQKWVLQSGTWTMIYVLQAGLDIGIQYGVANYPAAINPATGGCRNIAGQVNRDGTVTIWAITSTVSQNGDTGADPNKLVRVTDVISSMTVPAGDGDGDRDDRVGTFRTLRTARAGEVFRGVALAPTRDGDDDGR